MAYNNNIPLATDKLSVSQGDLLGNFSEVSTYLNVNHVDFNGANQGKHKLVTLTDQTGSLPTTAGADIDIYLGTDPAYPLLNNQVWFQNGGGDKIPWTAARTLTSGFTYLPSGIIQAWTILIWVGAGNNTQNLNTSAFGGTFPGFGTGILNIQITPIGASSSPYVVSIGAGPTYTLTYNVSTAAGSAYLFVTGI